MAYPSRTAHSQGCRGFGRMASRQAAGERSSYLPIEKELSMKESTKNEAAGKVHEVKGKVKEKLGKATNNPRLQDEGQDEKVAGKIQKKIGQVQKVFEE
jgi:uncharacterized protein YjbJ (UPF0337 family)